MPTIKVLPRGKRVTNPLAKGFHRNVYSQGGEDGVLAEIFRIIGTRNKWCVEFGAWDGVFLSNTCNLIRNDGWSAVLIEGNPEKCEKIRENYPGNDKVIPLCAMIGFEKGVDTIDHHLGTTPIPRDFDLLSIDVDGIDWHIWESIVDHRPRIVVIEFNPTVPNDVVFIQDRDMAINEGCSAAALVALARDKGYELVATTNGNCFFVVREEFGKFADVVKDNRLDVMRNDRDNFVWCTYNGKVYQTMRRLSWWGKNYEFGPESLQFLSEFWFQGKFQGRPATAPGSDTDLATSVGIIREFLELRSRGHLMAPDILNTRTKAVLAAAKAYLARHRHFVGALTPNDGAVERPTLLSNARYLLGKVTRSIAGAVGGQPRPKVKDAVDSVRK